MAGMIGYGAIVSWETTPGGGTYTAMNNVLEADVPNVECEVVDTTHLGSAGRVREYALGMKTPPEITITQLYAEADYLALSALNGVARAWKVAAPDGSHASGNGILTKSEVKFDLDVAKITHTVKMTGAVTWTTA